MVAAADNQGREAASNADALWAGGRAGGKRTDPAAPAQDGGARLDARHSSGL